MWLVVAVRHFAVRRERWIPRSWCGLCRLQCASFAASVLRDRFQPWIKHDAPEFPDQRRQFGGLPHELLRFGECCLPEVVASGMCVTRYLVPHSEARLSGPPCFLVCFQQPSRLCLISPFPIFCCSFYLRNAKSLLCRSIVKLDQTSLPIICYLF